MELPEGCIADILCHTTPLDVARISVISKIFCSAADSDTIWDHFLPSDYRSIISMSPSLTNAPSKKALYLALSDHPIIIDQGKKSFQLDRKSGKKCYMLAARALYISSGDDERYCHWVTLPESRFEEVAKLKVASRSVICGKINTVDLSSNTQYASFLVFKLINAHGFHCKPMFLLINISGGHICYKAVCLDLRSKAMDSTFIFRNVRSDGLLEIEIGEFFNSGQEDGEVEMCVMMIEGNGSFYLEGIEVRPKILIP
ncbi:putative F-box protein PP2-B12 [Lotus japonicus]|uniref:putative F-box protein PP2-B12 n=1 Tax=Lotus japonicus TaxID=34305 RepID=UPI00258CA008|nr:putative F-box protein PP2-B12 [Lotus japonicus]XP_057425692.1 putative F-box protein PP2-B12 [Lotus japonicus]